MAGPGRAPDLEEASVGHKKATLTHTSQKNLKEHHLNDGMPSSPCLWDRRLLQKLSWDIRQTRKLSPDAQARPAESEPDAWGTQEAESLGFYYTL